MSNPRQRRPKAPPAAKPVFFLSYSRIPAGHAGDLSDPIAEQRQFFYDLTRAVNQLLPIPAGDPIGFMDTGLEAGVNWNAELLRNLDSATVFVALISARYVNLSKWCPMEWDYFARRKVTARAGAPPKHNATAILPVLWAPVDGPLPPRITDVQHFEPATAAFLPRHRTLYLEEGVLGMQKYHEGQGAYDAVVWSLARQIQIRVNSLEVRPSFKKSTTGLRRSFWTGA
jgi:hypothetical protein